MTADVTSTVSALTSWSTLSCVECEQWARDSDVPGFRGRQLYDALNKRGVASVADIFEFPKTLRDEMEAHAPARSVRPRLHLKSPSDKSEKALLELHDGTTIEAVLMRSEGSTGRLKHTICVSSQVGCPAACSFCATGLQGLTRNLTATEIVDQVMYFVPGLATERQRVTNIVFMGMGEPLLNTKQVREAIARLTDPQGFGLGERHITVSTVGIVPQLRQFASWAGQVNLAVSLHAPNDALRSTLVPYNERFPIGDLLAAVDEYTQRTHRRVSFEYVLLKGVNDSDACARELGALLCPLGGLVHVNVIPWNPFRGGKFVRSEGPDADTFTEILRRSRVNATIRYSKGLDISAACGQLREREKAAAP